MIRDRNRIQYDDILTALRCIRDHDQRFYEPYPHDANGLKNLRADLDAIIASASGALAAAGLPADEVRARALGECV